MPDKIQNKNDKNYNKDEKCYIDSGSKRLIIQPNIIYNTSNTNRCWNKVSNLDNPTNYMGVEKIIDYTTNKKKQYCCKINKFIIPHTQIMPNNTNIFGKCYELNDTTKTNVTEDNPNHTTLTSNITDICKSQSINGSPELINFCKNLQCCSNKGLT